MKSILYRNGAVAETDLPLAKLSDPKPNSGEALWIDVAESDHATIAELSERFNLHPLAVDDLHGEPQRARLDRFENHYLLTAYGTTLGSGERMTTHAIRAVLTRGTMITVRGTHSIDMAPVQRQWESNPELLTVGAIAMLWSLLDNIVDTHFDTVQALDERASDLEAEVFADKPNIRVVQRKCFVLHREVTRLRRLSMPLRDITNSALRHDPQGANSAVTPYLQDVYDHALRVADWSDNIHDTLSTLFDSILNAQSNQLNIVMKKITGWAALIAVPTMLTGYFGMNVLYPGYQTEWGAWLVTLLMGGSAAFLYWRFRHNDWL